MKKAFILIAVIVAATLAIRSYNSCVFHVEKETRFMMGTYVTIYAIGPKKLASKAIDSALCRMQEIDVKFNPLNPKSPIYVFNHTGAPISDPEILGLIRIALDVSKESGGAFDITVAPLLELWGFYGKDLYIPKKQELKDCLSKVGYRHLSLNNGKLKRDRAGVKIDLGGIAKGYALEQAVKVLKSEGVHSALVDAGGDIYALGKKGNRLWKIGIKNPRGGDVLEYVEVEDLAVMSSGDYERFFIKDGKRQHHIFNPKTGHPTEGVASVTLIYSDPVLAQPWAKIPFVLGAEKGLKMLEKIPGMKAIVITDSGEKFYIKGRNVAKKI